MKNYTTSDILEVILQIVNVSLITESFQIDSYKAVSYLQDSIKEELYTKGHRPSLQLQPYFIGHQ